MLSIPYSGSSARLLAKQYLAAHSRRYFGLVAGLALQSEPIRRLDASHQSRLAVATSNPINVTLPATLTIALDRAARPSKVLTELAALRTDTAPLRRRLLELHHADTVEDVEDIQRAINDGAKSVASDASHLTQTLLEGIGSAAFDPTGSAWIAPAVAKAIEAGGNPLWRRAANFLFNRQLWVLTRLRSQTGEARFVSSRLQQLWDLDDASMQHLVGLKDGSALRYV